MDAVGPPARVRGADSMADDDGGSAWCAPEQTKSVGAAGSSGVSRVIFGGDARREPTDANDGHRCSRDSDQSAGDTDGTGGAPDRSPRRGVRARGGGPVVSP